MQLFTLQLQGCDRQTRALILSIAVCYYVKLQRRKEFEKFISPLIISSSPMTSLNIDDVFRKEITRYLFLVCYM